MDFRYSGDWTEVSEYQTLCSTKQNCEVMHLLMTSISDTGGAPFKLAIARNCSVLLYEVSRGPAGSPILQYT